MTIGLIGRKRGMTRVFTETGESVPVTVIEVLANRVSQVRTEEVDGYTALQVAAENKKANRVNKAMAGHFAKAEIEPAKVLGEFRINAAELENFQVGKTLPVDLFEAGQKVDVTGTSKGKGFAGGVKRHNFKTQDATHGNSLSHRAPGSIGQCQTPGRVFKGKKMAGHMGDEQVTTQNLELVKVDTERSLLLIKGAVPGATGGKLVVKPAIKAR